MKCIALTVIALIVFSLSGYSQALPAKKEQYDFLRWYLSYKKPVNLLRGTTSLTDMQIITADGLRMMKLKITTKDREYFIRQITANRASGMFDTTLLNNAEWQKPGDTNQAYTRLSLPIFSRDRKMVIIINDYYHQEGEMSYSTTGPELYIKLKNGSWKLAPLQLFGKGESFGQSE